MVLPFPGSPVPASAATKEALMPRHKSLLTVIRELVPQEVRAAMQSLLGSFSCSKRPAGRWSDQRVQEGAPSRAARRRSPKPGCGSESGAAGGLARVTWGRRVLDVVQAGACNEIGTASVSDGDRGGRRRLRGRLELTSGVETCAATR